MATLRVVDTPSPPQAGRSFELVAGEQTIGREKGNDIQLADQGVSRRHLRLVFDGIDWEAIDQGSGNGLFVNGERVERRRLADGDRLKVGQTTLVFESPDAAPPTTMLCLGCGTPWLPQSRFCLRCGRPLGAEARVPAQAAAPPAGPTAAPPAQAAPIPTTPAPALIAATPRASGCAMGCLVLSIVLLVTSIGGSLTLLYRTGHLPIPFLSRTGVAASR
jgi:hypothetical protein